MTIGIVYAIEEPPDEITRSVFLVGPTPRSRSTPSWRPQMIEALDKAGFDGTVFVPESKFWAHSYEEQVEWEHRCLNMSDLVIAWVPRDLETMPAFTTNVEFGILLKSNKLLYGRPDGSPKTRYLDYCYRQETGREPAEALQGLASLAVEKLGRGALEARHGGQRSVPMFIWTSEMFQDWLWTQEQAGNRLDDAKVLWSHLVGSKKDFLFCFAIWVKVWVEIEGRWKENEFILSRPDISCVVAFHHDRGKIEVLCVKEFRAPARTKDGFVHELPGGSSKAEKDPRELAAKELQEETGLDIQFTRLQVVGRRQLAATFSTHAATVFAVMLTDQERNRLLRDHGVHGEEGSTERTYIEMRGLENILWSEDLDWSSLGMILTTLDQLRIKR